MTITAELPGAALSAADLATVLDALDFAAEYRRYRASLTCEACSAAPAEVCGDHAADVERAAEYDALAERLRTEPGRQAQPPASADQLACPECGATDFELWLGGRHAGEVSCRGCGLLFVPRAFTRARQDADDYQARMSLEAAQAEADLRASGYRDDDDGA